MMINLNSLATSLPSLRGEDTDSALGSINVALFIAQKLLAGIINTTA